jgi:hemoglobin/transferrin/lactoferrin receptor protein
VQSDIGGFRFDYGSSYVLEDTNGRPYISGRMYADSNSGAVKVSPSIGTREVWSGFSRAEWEVVNWLKFNAGLRYDGFSIKEKGQPYVVGNYKAVYVDKDGARLNPTIGVTVTPVAGLQFYALYTEGYRPPSLRETIGSDSGLAPNPALRPETARNKEFGMNFLKDSALVEGDKLRFKASYFINNAEDYISRVQNPNAAPGAPFFSVDNLARAMFTGIELSGSYDAGMFFSQAAFTYYTDFEFCRTLATCAAASVANDYMVNQLPPQMTNSLTVGARLFDKRLTIGGRVNYAGARLGPLPVSAQQTNFWLPYTVVDAFVSYKVTDDVTFDLKGENLADRYYIDALNGWMPSPGRTIRASMTATF